MKELRKIILNSVETLDKNFDENTSFKNLDVDSLDLYSIIQKIEDKYTMKIDVKDFKNISSPKKLFAFLKKKNVFLDRNWAAKTLIVAEISANPDSNLRKL